jgi:hypothetical protein
VLAPKKEGCDLAIRRHPLRQNQPATSSPPSAGSIEDKH